MPAIKVFGVVANRAVAEQAIGNLRIAGFEQDDISLIVVQKEAAEELEHLQDQTGEGAKEVAARAGKGAAIGVGVGLAGGLVTVSLPGIDPIIGTGILVALFGFSGAFVGALAGAFSTHKVSTEVIERYGMALREGQAIIEVTAPNEGIALVARDTLLESGATNVNSYMADETDLAESPSFEDITR
jgi:hypothetical protein